MPSATSNPRAAVVAALLCVVALACGGDDDGSSPDAGLDCASGCEATRAADCAMGPATQAECETPCLGHQAGDCAAEHEALRRCAEGEAITCNAEGFPVVTACSSEQDAFVACLN